jgi:hypothetical protein
VKRWLHSVIGILVFALAGPPIGALVAWLTMGLPSRASPVPFIQGSWQEGGVLALAVGIITALAARFGNRGRGYHTWCVPGGAALAVSAAFILLTTDLPNLARVSGVLLPPAIVASLVCWLLTRRLFAH